MGKIFHWGPGPLDAWTNEVADWTNNGNYTGDEDGSKARQGGKGMKISDANLIERYGATMVPLEPSGGGGGSWEMPDGSDSGNLYRDATTLDEEGDIRGAGMKAKKEKYPVRGFWPNSNDFQDMKGAEQKVLLSTMHPEPRPDADKEDRSTVDKAFSSNQHEAEVESEKKPKSHQLPFRDGIYASRAQRLLSLAAAQRVTRSDGTSVPKPWLLMVGFSLPHEPVRFPKWAWDLYADADDDGNDDGNGHTDNINDNRKSYGGDKSAYHKSGSIDAVGSSYGNYSLASGSGLGVNQQQRKKRQRLPITAAMHATRPLGSPIFAFGDLKERFVYYDHGYISLTTVQRPAHCNELTMLPPHSIKSRALLFQSRSILTWLDFF